MKELLEKIRVEVEMLYPRTLEKVMAHVCQVEKNQIIDSKVGSQPKSPT